MGLEKKAFGTTPDGRGVELFVLTNAHGIRASIMTFGGVMVSLETPDRKGKLTDILLGFDNAADYAKPSCPYFNSIIGRYGNRIAKGRFVLDGKTYTLATNNGPNHLHGGIKGFDKVHWRAEPAGGEGKAGVKLSYVSPDGEEGYPGKLSVAVTYALTDQDELVVEYEAQTDKPTVVNLTQHNYYNLAGPGAGDVLQHELHLNAEQYTPVNDELIPTGAAASVKGTVFDFRTPRAMGERIAQTPGKPNGYDHNFVLHKPAGATGPTLAARVVEPTSGRAMEVHTTEPGVQFYSGNFLDGTLRGKGGVVYGKHHGFCLETQHFPDSPNQPQFPSTVLRPGQKYATTTVHKFSVR